MSKKHSSKFTYKFWSKDMYPYVYEARKEYEENLKRTRKRKKKKMSEESKRELLSFLDDTYNGGDWQSLVDYIDNNFISKKEIGGTEE